MDPDTDVCQTGQPQISYSVDFIAEQSSAMGSPNLLGREGTPDLHVHLLFEYLVCERFSYFTTRKQISALYPVCGTGSTTRRDGEW